MFLICYQESRSCPASISLSLSLSLCVCVCVCSCMCYILRTKWDILAVVRGNGKVSVRVGSSVMYVYESPRKDRNTRVSVCVGVCFLPQLRSSPLCLVQKRVATAVGSGPTSGVIDESVCSLLAPAIRSAAQETATRLCTKCWCWTHLGVAALTLTPRESHAEDLHLMLSPSSELSSCKLVTVLSPIHAALKPSALVWNNSLLPQKPVSICSAAVALALKLNDWLPYLSGFYLQPWFISIPSMSRRTQQRPLPLLGIILSELFLKH